MKEESQGHMPRSPGVICGRGRMDVNIVNRPSDFALNLKVNLCTQVHEEGTTGVLAKSHSPCKSCPRRRGGRRPSPRRGYRCPRARRSTASPPNCDLVAHARPSSRQRAPRTRTARRDDVCASQPARFLHCTAVAQLYPTESQTAVCVPPAWSSVARISELHAHSNHTSNDCRRPRSTGIAA